MSTLRGLIGLAMMVASGNVLAHQFDTLTRLAISGMVAGAILWVDARAENRYSGPGEG